MSKVYYVQAQVAARSDSDQGRVAEGYYSIEGGVVVMTSPKGVPIRDVEGLRIEHKLAPGESADLIARRLTLKIHRSLYGDDAGGFHRPTSSLKYQKWVY